MNWVSFCFGALVGTLVTAISLIAITWFFDPTRSDLVKWWKGYGQ